MLDSVPDAADRRLRPPHARPRRWLTRSRLAAASALAIGLATLGSAGIAGAADGAGNPGGAATSCPPGIATAQAHIKAHEAKLQALVALVDAQLVTVTDPATIDRLTHVIAELHARMSKLDSVLAHLAQACTPDPSGTSTTETTIKPPAAGTDTKPPADGDEPHVPGCTTANFALWALQHEHDALAAKVASVGADAAAELQAKLQLVDAAIQRLHTSCPNATPQAPPTGTDGKPGDGKPPTGPTTNTGTAPHGDGSTSSTRPGSGDKPPSNPTCDAAGAKFASLLAERAAIIEKMKTATGDLLSQLHAALEANTKMILAIHAACPGQPLPLIPSPPPTSTTSTTRSATEPSTSTTEHSGGPGPSGGDTTSSTQA